MTQGQSMFKNNKLTLLIFQTIAIFAILLSTATTAQAKSKQQNTFLDAAGNPIPDDVLLSLISIENKPKSKPISPSPEDKHLSTGKDTNPKKKHLSNPILEKELLHAMKAGQVTRVNQLLKARIRPTYKNYKGETPLGIAVSRGWASMVIKLLDSGADLKEKGTQGVTLLHSASAHGMTDVAKVLVKHGLSPHKKTDKNWTALHIAARYGHWELVQYYIKIGVDPDIRNSDGKTALGLARHLRHMGVIKMLSQVTTVRSLAPKKRSKRKKRSKKQT